MVKQVTREIVKAEMQWKPTSLKVLFTNQGMVKEKVKSFCIQQDFKSIRTMKVEDVTDSIILGAKLSANGS